MEQIPVAINGVTTGLLVHGGEEFSLERPGPHPDWSLNSHTLSEVVLFGIALLVFWGLAFRMYWKEYKRTGRWQPHKSQK